MNNPKGEGPYRTAHRTAPSPVTFKKELFPRWEDWLKVNEDYDEGYQRKIKFVYTKDNLCRCYIRTYFAEVKTYDKTLWGSSPQDAFEKVLERLRKDVG